MMTTSAIIVTFLAFASYAVGLRRGLQINRARGKTWHTK